LYDSRVPAAVKGSVLELALDLPPGAPPVYDQAASTLHLANQSSYVEIDRHVAEVQAKHGTMRVVQVPKQSVIITSFINHFY
jgi:hypothetical protein